MAENPLISLAPSQNWDGNDGLWSTFALQIGTPPQIIRVLPSTSGSEVLGVLPEGCIPGAYQDLVNCRDRRGLFYQPNTSSTFDRLGDQYYMIPVAEPSLGNFTGGAEAGYDNLTFGWLNEGGPLVKNHSVFAYSVKNPFLGQFGLSHWPVYLNGFNDPQQSLLDSFRTAGLIAGWSWSYTAGAHYRINNAFASLTIGGRDTSKYDNNNIAEFQLGSDNYRDLLISLSAVSIADASSSQALSQDLPVTVLLDSSISSLYLPSSLCNYFEAAFNLTWDDDTNLYLLNSTHHDALVNRNPSVTFTLESTSTSVNITLPYSAFDLTASYPLLGDQVNASLTSYYFPLQRGRNASEYALGRVFLQEAYLTVDYDRGNFSVAQTKFPDTIPGPQSESPLQAIYPPGYGSDRGARKLSHGAIAGIVIAAVCLVIFLLAFCTYLWRRRRSKRDTSVEDRRKAKIAEHAPEPHNKPTSLTASGSDECAELHADPRISELPDRLVQKNSNVEELDGGAVAVEIEGGRRVIRLNREREPIEMI